MFRDYVLLKYFLLLCSISMFWLCVLDTLQHFYYLETCSPINQPTDPDKTLFIFFFLFLISQYYLCWIVWSTNTYVLRSHKPLLCSVLQQFVFFTKKNMLLSDISTGPTCITTFAPSICKDVSNIYIAFWQRSNL